MKVFYHNYSFLKLNKFQIIFISLCENISHSSVQRSHSRQGASEDKNFGEKPTPPKTDSSGCFGIKDNKFEEELPDTLTVLTTAVLKRILTKGKMSSYGGTNDQWTLSRTDQKTPGGCSLFVGSDPSFVLVTNFYFAHARIGVGGPRKFRQLELEYLALESGH
jgi:hypothetical protein